MVGHCFYCGCLFGRDGRKSTEDHLTPRSRGGDNAYTNIVLSCQVCNGDKGRLTLEEYRLVIAFRRGLVGEATFPVFDGEKNDTGLVMGCRVENIKRVRP